MLEGVLLSSAHGTRVEPAGNPLQLQSGQGCVQLPSEELLLSRGRRLHPARVHSSEQMVIS